MRITKFHKPILLTVIGLACLGLLLLVPKQATAANPATINFQGKIVNFTDGTNITNPNNAYSVVFRIYNTSSPTMTTSCTSTASCAWQETQASVQLTNGVFQVELGSSCALTSGSCNNSAFVTANGGPINFANNNSLYLTMQFNGDTSGSNGGFMSPLIHITSVPYALQADNAASLGGLAAANYVQLAQAVQTDSSTSNASIGINKTGGTANIITLQRGGTPVFVLDTNGALSLTPNGNNVGTVIRQTSGTATSGNIFDIQGANGTSHFIQVAETAANAGSISITSLGSNAVTIDSGSGTVIFGSTTTTVQKSGSAFTVDITNGASNSTLNVSNSGGAGNITLNLDAGGSYAVGGTSGTTASACSGGQFLTGTLSGGIVTSGSCGTPTAYSTVQDEGTNLTQRSTLNFTGAGVSCADNAGSTRTDCTINGGGGGTFASTYSTTTQASNTITYSNSGGGALILQNASTPLTTLLTIQNNAATFNYLTVTLASSVPHLQVFGASSTEYADIYYDAASHTAFFRASGTNTTQVGSGTGPVNITAGASSAVAITGHANSTFTTDSGYVRLDGPSGVQLGVPSSSSGNLVFNYGSGAATATITFAGNANANYIYTLPSTAVSSSQCLQSGTVSGTSVPLTFGSCGSGSGTALSVDAVSVGSTANFADTASSGTVTSVNFTNTSGTVTAAIGNASTTAAGSITTGSQSFAGDKIFQSTTNSSTAFQLQNSVGAAIFSVDTTSTDATGAQLNYLAYSGFESGAFNNASAGWNAVSPGTISQNTNKQHTFNGTHSVQLTTTTSNGGLTTSSFAATPSTTGNYLISFYAKVTSGASMTGANFTVQTTDGATHTCNPSASVTLATSTVGFQRLFCQLTTTGTITAMQITQNNGVAHTIYIDSVQLQRTAYNGGTLTAPSAYQFGEIYLRGVISNPLIVANNGDSTSAFQVQKSNGSAIITADTLNGQVLLGNSSSLTGLLTFNNSSGANTVGITSGNVSTSYTITLPTAVAAANNYCLVSTTGGVTSWAACGASSSTATVTLSPEFEGAVMTGDGTANSGTMTSDFCSGSSRQNIGTAVCTVATESHNYYDWTSNGANDYEIWVRWQAPSDFASFSTGSFNGWKTASGDAVTMNVYNNSASTCATQATSATTGSWQNNPITMTGCAPSAGNVITIDIHLAVAANGNHARIGEITLTYNRN